MNLIIKDDTMIKSLQEEFTQVFPFLKIEFFTKRHKNGEGSSKVYLKKEDARIGDCRKKGSSGILKISEKQKVSEIEQLFQDVFGLPVQIFRKSGKVWLETTSTDDWTLEKQNDQAKELSLPVND